MQDELFAHPTPGFAATRKDALQQLDAFIPFAGRYSRDRNHVLPGHTNVSKLSPAIRHRLILESECAAAPLCRYAASTVEKFTQEVYWRRYWKTGSRCVRRCGPITSMNLPCFKTTQAWKPHARAPHAAKLAKARSPS